MINSVTELKELIIWLKTQRVKSLTVGGIIVELSDYAFIESLSDEAPAPSTPGTPTVKDNGLEEPASADKAEDDEALFWSSRS